MPATVAIVADDLTGAADTAVGFLPSGEVTLVAWADPELDPALVEQADVLAIDLQSRELDVAQARAKTTRVVTALRTAGVTTLYKKADSMLRGHVGGEVEAALAAWHPQAFAIVALAFPGTGRTTVAGRQRINGVALGRPAIPAILEMAGVTTRHADLACVRGGSLGELFAECRGLSVDAVVCDAERDDDLRLIAAAGGQCGPGVVWVGSGGLAPMVSSGLRESRSGIRGAGSDAAAKVLSISEFRAARLEPDARSTSPRVAPPEGPILVVVGSASGVAGVQAADVVAAGAAGLALSAADRSCDAAFSRALEERLRSGADVVLTLEPPSAEADRSLALRLADLVRPFAPIVGGLVVSGGDTATGVLGAWNTTALRLVCEIEPGVPLSMSVAPHPIPVITKAGAFGDAATLTRARARLKITGGPP